MSDIKCGLDKPRLISEDFITLGNTAIQLPLPGSRFKSIYARVAITQPRPRRRQPCFSIMTQRRTTGKRSAEHISARRRNPSAFMHAWNYKFLDAFYMSFSCQGFCVCLHTLVYTGSALFTWTSSRCASFSELSCQR